MITKIPKRRANPRALLDYLQGEGDPHRRLLDTDFVSRTPRGIAEELLNFTRVKRYRLTDFTKHMILSLAPGEDQTHERYLEIALEYLRQMGYEDAPYAIYLHTDTPHPHLHIVTTPTTWEGGIINEWNDWPRSEAVARKLEQMFGLKPIESSLSAQRKAKKQEEVHARARKGEESHRERFQREIAEAAVMARTLPEFVEGVVARGYEIRVALSRQGELRGLSFGQNGQHFRGTQLGRAYTGGQLLTSFGLDYQPQQHQAALEATAAAHRRSVTLMAVAEKNPPSPSSDSSLPDPQPPGPRRLESPAPLRLPDEIYQIGVLDPTRLQPHPKRIEEGDMRLVRSDWRRATIEENRAWFGHKDHTSMMVIRPTPEGQAQIGFRGVSADQLAEMKADGFEPAWVVKVGSSYDVLLRTHEKLTREQTNDLWTEVGARYGLQVPGGFFRDGVRMPGTAVRLPEGRVVAELVECSCKPFSQSELLVREVRDAPEREVIRRDAEQLQGAVAGKPEPAAALAAQAAAPVRLPADSPLAPLQALAEEARALRFPHPVMQQSNAELLTIGQEAHRQIRDAAELLRSAGVQWNREEWRQLQKHPALKDLLAVEAELSRRRVALEEHLGRLEEPLRAQAASLDAQAREINARPELAAIHQYQKDAQRFAESQAELGHAERAHFQVLSYQATLDRERAAVAVIAEPRDTHVATAHVEAVRREAELSRGAGRSIVPEVQGERSTLMARLEALEREVVALRREVAGKGIEVLPAMEAKVREQVGTQDALDRAMARESTQPKQLEAVLARNDRPEMLRTFWEHQGALAERATQERGWRVELLDPADRLKQAAARVGDGDLSPDALRRLNAEVVRNVPGSAIPPPVFKAPNEARELVERYLKVREDIVHLTRQVTTPEGLDRAGRTVLLSRSAEALALHQHVEALHRRSLGVLHPEAAPRGISQAAWDLAWLRRAAENGLLPAQAQSHLGNVLRAPMAAGSLATGRVLWLGAMALRTMASKLQSFAHRVLSQG